MTSTVDASIYDHYKNLSKAQDTVRIYDKQDYFVVICEDAEFIAQNIFKSPLVIKYAELAEKVAYLTLTTLSCQSTIRSLLKQMLSIEIYAFDRKWSLSKSASPGNVLEIEDAFETDSSDTPVLMAIDLDLSSTAIGVRCAYVNVLMNQFGVSLLEDSEQLNQLESTLIQLNVREVLIDKALEDQLKEQKMLNKKFRNILNQLEIKLTVLTSGLVLGFSSLKDVLSRVVRNKDALNVLTEDSVKAFQLLLRMISIEAFKEDEFTFESYQATNYMQLDKSALAALYVFPRDESRNISDSLSNLLSFKCNTRQGRRLIQEWLRKPLIQLDEINRRLDIVRQLINDSALRSELAESLKGTLDIFVVFKKLYKGKKVVLKDIVRLYDTSVKLPGMVQVLEATEGPCELVKKFSVELKDASEKLEKFTELVQLTIDMSDPHDYKVNADFDEELKGIKQAMEEIKKDIDEQALSIASELGLEFEKKVKLERNGQHGFHMRLVSKTDAGKLKRMKGIHELSTLKSGVLFQNDELSSLSDAYENSRATFELKQKDLVDEVLDITRSYHVIFEQVGSILTQLDAFVSLAAASMVNNYSRPLVHPIGQGSIKLPRSRHPLVELQEAVNFIPNDIEMTRDKSHFVVLTGSNMAGKSTLLRQIGAAAIMAQMGCFVPADSGAELPLFDSILCRVGANDKLAKGISTFMLEMLDSANILNNVTENSLVLIDELGRGTSTSDGFGLAYAISKTLIEKSCFGLFATHFHELAELEAEEGVTNMFLECTITDGEFILLYQLKRGSSDKSFGLNVAELCKFPPEVVELSKRKLKELEMAEKGVFPERDASVDAAIKKIAACSFLADMDSDDDSHDAEINALMEEISGK